jgi:hypothetical protein
MKRRNFLSALLLLTGTATNAVIAQNAQSRPAPDKARGAILCLAPCGVVKKRARFAGLTGA